MRPLIRTHDVVTDTSLLLSLPVRCMSTLVDSDYEASPFALDADDATAQESRQSRSATAAHAHTRIRPETTAAAAAKGSARRSKQGDPKRKARRPPSRICKFDGCEQYVVDQGLCVRHGVRHSRCVLVWR